MLVSPVLSLLPFCVLVSAVLSLLPFCVLVSAVLVSLALSLLPFCVLVSVVLSLLLFCVLVSLVLPLFVFSVQLFSCFLELGKLMSGLVEDIAQFSGNFAVSAWPVLHWRPACIGGFNNSTSIVTINFLLGDQLTNEPAQSIRPSLSRYLGRDPWARAI